MAFFAAAIPLLTKAGAALKGLSGVKALTGLAGAAKGGAAKGVLGSLGTRMAGSKFLANAGAMMPKSAGQWGMRVAPDALFGVMTGAMTPGDLGDKLIAGTTATIGGAAGGLVTRGAVGGIAPKLLTPNNPAYNGTVDIGLEMLGGIGGDIAAQGVADGILRAKGGGMTPYEKMAAEQQRQLEEDILRRYLSGKGGYPSADPTLVANGLG